MAWHAIPAHSAANHSHVLGIVEWLAVLLCGLILGTLPAVAMLRENKSNALYALFKVHNGRA